MIREKKGKNGIRLHPHYIVLWNIIRRNKEVKIRLFKKITAMAYDDSIDGYELTQLINYALNKIGRYYQ